MGDLQVAIEWSRLLKVFCDLEVSAGCHADTTNEAKRLLESFEKTHGITGEKLDDLCKLLEK